MERHEVSTHACGCRLYIVPTSHFQTATIEWCPLHAAAEAMRLQMISLLSWLDATTPAVVREDARALLAKVDKG